MKFDFPIHALNRFGSISSTLSRDIASGKKISPEGIEMCKAVKSYLAASHQFTNCADALQGICASIPDENMGQKEIARLKAALWILADQLELYSECAVAAEDAAHFLIENEKVTARTRKGAAK